MVKMRMGKDDRVDSIRGNLEVPVFPVGFGASPLKGPAIDEKRMSVNLENVF